MLPAPPGWPGLLHQACPGGQECTVQAVQLRLGQERQALSQRVSKARQEGWVSVAAGGLTVDINMFLIIISHISTYTHTSVCVLMSLIHAQSATYKIIRVSESAQTMTEVSIRSQHARHLADLH